MTPAPGPEVLSRVDDGVNERRDEDVRAEVPPEQRDQQEGA